MPDRRTVNDADLLLKYSARLWRLLTTVFDMEVGMVGEESYVYEIRVRAPRFEGDNVMVVVKASGPIDKQVAFHSDVDAGLALKGALERVYNKSANFRADEPYRPRLSE